MTSPANNKITAAIEAANLPKGHVMAQSVAIAELKPFIEHHTDKEFSDEEIEEDYPDVLLAIQKGKLNVSNPDAPVLQLKDPVKTESGAIVRESITFKTRMKAMTKETLFKGVNIAQEQQKYTNISVAYFAGLDTRAELNSFSKFDEKVVQQIVTLFM